MPHHHFPCSMSTTTTTTVAAAVTKAAKKTCRILNTPLSGILGADALILMLSTVGSILAMVGAMTIMIGGIQADYVDIVTAIPDFDFYVDSTTGHEMGNDSFMTFSFLRDIANIFFILVFVLVAFLLLLKQVQLVSNDTIKKVFLSAAGGMILLAIFPYMWDDASQGVEDAAIFMLNPAYSGDETNPCAVSASDRYIVSLMDTNNEIHDSMTATSTLYRASADKAKDVCLPDLRIDYLFNAALHGTSVEIAADDGTVQGFLSGLAAHAESFGEEVFSTMFTGVSKISMLFFLATMASMIGAVRYLLVDVIVIAMPLLLVLRSFPFFYIDSISKTLLTAWVPLVLTPIFGSLIILAGSSNLYQMEQELDEEGALQLGSIGKERYGFWTHAMATLLLAVMIPVMFAPILGSFAQQASSMVMTGTIGGITAVSGAARGMISGAGSAMAQGGGGMAGLMAGAARGGMGGSMGGITSDISAGSSHLGGSVSPGMKAGGGPAGSNAFTDVHRETREGTRENIPSHIPGAAQAGQSSRGSRIRELFSFGGRGSTAADSYIPTGASLTGAPTGTLRHGVPQESGQDDLPLSVYTPVPSSAAAVGNTGMSLSSGLPVSSRVGAVGDGAVQSEFYTRAPSAEGPSQKAGTPPPVPQRSHPPPTEGALPRTNTEDPEIQKRIDRNLTRATETTASARPKGMEGDTYEGKSSGPPMGGGSTGSQTSSEDDYGVASEEDMARRPGLRKSKKSSEDDSD